MLARRIARFRARQGRRRNPGVWQRIQLRWGAVLLVLACLAIGVLLLWAPFYWATERLNALNAAWGVGAFEDAGRLEAHWVNLPPLAPFREGQEAHVKGFLARQPLVVAVLDRRQPRTLWIREGEGLVRAQGSPDEALYHQWITQAEAAQRFQFVPPAALNPDPQKQPALVLLGDRWVAVKRWRIGSPEVERALQHTFPEGCRCRLGLRRTGGTSHGLKPEAWGAEPHLQADAYRVTDRWFSLGTTSDAFQGWDLVAIPWLRESRPMAAAVLRHFWIASSFSAAVGLALGAGLWMRRRARLRATLDADRLAALTHSLKTPLAILKIRCDSIRLGRLAPEQQDAELIKLGEEVDHLTLIIEHGLEAIRGSSESGPQAEVGTGWLAQVAEDLAPAFEAEGRALHLELGPDAGRANLPSLRAALLTLLENALFHGGGAVTLSSHRHRKRLVLKVRDEGEGLEAHQLEALGRPFLRLRREGTEGFTRDGKGLGLTLLGQVARKEGWGLTFASAPGQGFTATIELRLA